MAITTNIPPQAYTRDTLVKALEWLNTQSPAVRERAGSADLIVSYYLQARRRMSAAQMEAPISGESFKADLKHLAEDLKQFEEPSAPPTQPSRSPSHGQFDHLQEINIPPMEMPASPRVTQPRFHQPVHETQIPPYHPEQVTAPPPPQSGPTASHSPSAPKVITWAIDARSLASARELQQRMNLSSETEAIRMLVTLGVERMREIFPR